MSIPLSRHGLGVHLTRTGIVAIVRAKDGARTSEVIAVLVDAGVTCLEITMNTPGALEAVRDARARYADTAHIGVGTVRSADQVAAAAAAGAQFIVTPDTRSAVARAVDTAGLAWFPGAFTATEASMAWELGAAAVKLFPASLGGPGYLRELRAPLEDVPFIPTGGVTLETAGEYLDAGAVALGVGSPLLGDALRGGALTGRDGLAGRAERLLAMVADTRSTS